MRSALLATLFLTAPVLAQAPAPEAKPADAKTTEQKPRTPLKLRLDEVGGSAPIITFTPREGAKGDPAATLPALGGKPSSALEKTPSQVVPKDLTPGQ
jgi:hypothetical protein